MPSLLTRARTWLSRPIATPLAPTQGSGGWYPIVREPYTGAWQQNDAIMGETVLGYWAVFACVSQIATDIGKLRLRLVEEEEPGIWTETTNPAYSPVLRTPNRYQTIQTFVEQWLASKLTFGNTYVLKERDQRGVVVALYVLDPRRVIPLVAPDGAVYYELRKRDDLAPIDQDSIVVPAREVIHDLMVPLFHPLVGVSPLFACGVSALHGLSMQTNASAFFDNGAKPSGILIAPGAIADETAARLKKQWEAAYSGPNVGRVAVVGDNLKYEQLTVSAADAQLIEQLKWTGETVCSCYRVPYFMIDSSKGVPYANSEALVQQYYAQCLQSLMVKLETALDAGLGIRETVNGTQYGTEFDPDDLVWLDTTTKTKAAHEAIASGALTPNEARKKWFGLGPVAGGDTPYMQQQYYALSALADRDLSAPAAPAPPSPTVPEVEPEPEADQLEAAAALLLAKDWKALYAA
jgi:HK97 family phage portal protein